MKSDSHYSHIVFFDGVCGLCNGFINFLVKRDKKHVLIYAPLQGSTVKEVIPEINTEHLDTIIYWRKGKIYHRSSAALLILKDVGGLWSFAYVLIVFPQFFRDWFYNIVAKNRYQWFGKRGACRLPSKEEKMHFLD